MNGLAVTVVVDSPGSRVWRACGKLWAASLLRHQWGGRVVVRRNFEHVLFPVERAGLEESAFGKPFDAGRDGGKAAAAECRDRLLEAAEAAAGGGDWEWVLLADADCVALRNLDHLFGGDADLLVSRGGGAPDPGFVAVRGGRLAEFAARGHQAGGRCGDSSRAELQVPVRRFRNVDRHHPDTPLLPASPLVDQLHCLGINVASLALGILKQLALYPIPQRRVLNPA